MKKELTRLRGELLGRYQVRKSAEQKAAFRKWALAYAQENGYEAKIERSGHFVDTRNVVIGDVDRAQTLITAHYDTCARLPFPNVMTPQNWPLIVVTQVLVPMLFLGVLGYGVGYGAGWLMHQLPVPAWAGLMLCSLTTLLMMIVIVALLICGPANPHTANDNTSGVALTLLALHAFAGRSDVAFVLFDNEEKGFLGSTAFTKAHQAAAKRAFVINFDCISDGRTLLYAGSKEAMKSAKARSVTAALMQVAPRYDRVGKTGTAPGTFYPSDQMVFRRGTAFAALRGRRVLYLSRIHTPRDTQFDERNLLCLLEVLTKALRQEVQ